MLIIIKTFNTSWKEIRQLFLAKSVDPVKTGPDSDGAIIAALI